MISGFKEVSRHKEGMKKKKNQEWTNDEGRWETESRELASWITDREIQKGKDGRNCTSREKAQLHIMPDRQCSPGKV